jgi:hypothetical protein
MMTIDGLIQIFKLAILDRNTLLAMNIFTDFSIEAITQNYQNLKYYFLKAMANRLEQICVFMLDNGFPLNVNEPVCRREDCIMPTYVLVAVSFGLNKLFKAMLKMNPDLSKQWYGVSPLMLATLKGESAMMHKIVEYGGSMVNGITVSQYLLLRTLKLDFLGGKEQDLLFYTKPIRQLKFPESPKMNNSNSTFFLRKKILPLEFAIIKVQEKIVQALLTL